VLAEVEVVSEILDALIPAYFKHLSPEDQLEWNADEHREAAQRHLDLARVRPAGTAIIRIGPDPYSSGSLLEIVTDDMPFLVDSVGIVLNQEGFDVLNIVHPQIVVRRDLMGNLTEVVAEGAVTSAHTDVPESWMRIETERIAEEDIPDLERRLRKVLLDVREAVEDWPKMHSQVDRIIDSLSQTNHGLAAREVDQGRDFLHWLADDHFTFLGYREYLLERIGDDEVLRAVPGTGLGILRGDPNESGSFSKLPPLVKARAREKHLLVLAKANARATVHRPAHLDYIAVKTFDSAGEVIGEQRFLGLFSSGAYTESVVRIPLLREKVSEVIDAAGFEPNSHSAKALLDVLETYPRDELFQTDVEDLTRIAVAVMQSRERRALRLFVRSDVYGRFLSCLVYLPRDRYNTAVRSRLSKILMERLGGESVDFTVRLSESVNARVHFVVRLPAGRSIPHDIDVAAIERQLAEAARSWDEDFSQALRADDDAEAGAHLAKAHPGAFPEAYKEDYPAATGASDLRRLVALGADEIGVKMERSEADPRTARLKIYRTGAPLVLSHVLPMLSSLGVEVTDERPYSLDGVGDGSSHIYDFGLRAAEPLPAEAVDLVQDAFVATWQGHSDDDGFNALVLSAGITWRQAMVLRAYTRYLRQGGLPYSQEYVEYTLRANVAIARDLVSLFETRFDPAFGEVDGTKRQQGIESLTKGLTAALNAVAALDQDRILRSLLAVITSTLRTNYFQMSADGTPHSYLAVKIDPSGVPDLPAPRPKFEIWVHSPRIEGVHLRFGAVARGGLRWSDRRDDFRTEVLGLVKAQMVKNTVIVPVGAKGGFVCRRSPDPAVDRQAWLDEGIACYKTFISALLDITDNLVRGDVVAPIDVIRHDVDDPYLVVAADKGTATFSDIANSVAADYGFWLGDAFASGGSVGYDHKAMGITAKGAWVSVQRHFRERGLNPQTEDFTVVGIGDMSGDVFGNGMLCSEHIKLLAAFDHRDIFLDPNPDPAASFAERARMFALPRSSWQDYDTSLISAGGGVYSRSEKSIPISAAVREALGLDEGVEAMSPPDLMHAILKAPVDLLWNGGIGTYVKAESETHADAGDKANDAIRVNGGEVRAHSIGEGGNLGCTQRGRVEYSLSGLNGVGGRMNTDFIDNSAGVDTSDHEVNIKILLDGVVDQAGLSLESRNTLLASMTDEVAELVLVDNYEQNLALANAVRNSAPMMHVHEDLMRSLERKGLLDRELEALPSRREAAARIEKKEGLTGPELSVLLAYAKITLADQLLATDIADDPFLRGELYSYFPAPLRQDYRKAMETHPLRREIIVTRIVNHLINGAGFTYLHRLGAETGATDQELVRANLVAREIFGSVGLIREVCAQDNKIDADTQTKMRIEVRTLVERVSRWLVTNRRPIDSEAIVDDFDVVVGKVLKQLPTIMSGVERTNFEARRDALMAEGVDEALAVRVAVMPPAYMLMGIVDNALAENLDAVDVAKVHFDLGERVGLPGLITRILGLPREDRWQTMARASLLDDLHRVHSQLTADVLHVGGAGLESAARVQKWVEHDPDLLARSVATLEEICADELPDLARLSVALRVVRGLVRTR